MSIHDLREQLKDLPGSERLTMTYGEDNTQVFCIDQTCVTVSPSATAEEIRAAFLGAWKPVASVKKPAAKRQVARKKTAKKPAKKRKS